MGKDQATPPYVVKRISGWYWQPTKAVITLGFPAKPLGADIVEAFAEGYRLNAELKKERERQTKDAFDKPVYEGTWQHLVDLYRGIGKIEPSRKWIDLSKDTQRNYNLYIDNTILPSWGDMAVSKTTTEAITLLHEGMSAKPYAANAFVRTVSTLLSFAMSRPALFDLGNWHRNPAQGVQKFGSKSGVKSRTQQWDDELESSFLDAAKEKNWEVYLGYALLYYTGQRLSDVLKMKVTDVDQDKIAVIQQKTGARVWIHQHSELKTILTEHFKLRRSQKRIGGTLLQDDQANKFSPRKFSEAWDEIEVKAGIDKADVQRRDLRRTAVIRLAEAGCTDFEIAAITGHSLKQIQNILQVYWVATYKQAESAIKKLEISRPYLAQKPNSVAEKLER